MLTKLERDYLLAMLEANRQPRTVAMRIDLANKDPTKRIVDTHADAIRLMDSDDYKAGWNACAEQVAEYMQTFLAQTKNRSLLMRRTVSSARRERIRKATE